MTDQRAPQVTFIVGAPRSGTGILQNLLRLHPDVAFVSQPMKILARKARKLGLSVETTFPVAFLLESLSVRWPLKWRPSLIARPFDGFLDDSHPVAVEGYELWTLDVTKKEDDRLTESHLTDDIKRYHRRLVTAYADWEGASTFLAKRARTGLQIPFFLESFPDAHFVHIVRDPVAVASSILKRRRRDNEGGVHEWWGPKPPGWRDVMTRPPVEQVGWQWERMARIITEDLSELPTEQTTLITYSELCEAPRESLAKCWGDAGLAVEPGISRCRQYFSELRNANPASRERLPEEDREVLESQLTFSPTDAGLDYEVGVGY